MRISDVISDLCSSDLHETGLLRLGALCLDISIHNLERSERATKLRRKIGCSALDQLDAMLTHHRTAPQALRIGRDKRHVIDAAEISDGGIKIVHQKRAAAKLPRGSILQCFQLRERRLLLAFKRDHECPYVAIGTKQTLVLISFA